MDNELAGASSDARLRTLERRIRHLRVLRSAKSRRIEPADGDRRAVHVARSDLK